MNWMTEPEEGRRLVERGAALFQRVVLVMVVAFAVAVWVGVAA